MCVATRLTDRQKKKIIADYVELGSYSAVAKKNGVSDNTVRNIVKGNSEISRKCELKKEQNTADILTYMESRKEQAQTVLDICLNALSNQEKIDAAKLSEIATVMGIVIDKFVNNPAENRMKEKRLEIELLKIENRTKDNTPEEEPEDNFLEALNATAKEVWSEPE